MKDKYYVYRPLLNLLGLSEGTDKGRGYNETLAYGAYTGGAVNLVALTLDKLDALQTKMLQHPKNSFKSSAAGRYQIVRTTMRQIKEKLDLPGTALYDEEMQDMAGCYLLGLRGIDKYLAGRLKEESLILNLSQEWASLPKPDGAGYYDGQRAAVTVAQVRQVLADVRRRHAEKVPVISVDKEVLPVSVDKEVTKKTDNAGLQIGGIGTLTTALTAVLGGNWETVLVVGALFIVALGVLLFARQQIIAAIRDIRESLGGG